jgi:DNA-directed RNA polymerase specialized sigma24 family protein
VLALLLARHRLGSVRTTARADLPRTMGDESPHRPAFVTTHWSVVLTASRSDTPRAQEALTKLCQTYWYPLYAYVRRRGHAPPDAQDLTQEFFARLIAGRWVVNADREKGRFRSFLLSTMNHFLADEWDKARAQKRGGGVTLVPLQFDTAETRYGLDPAAKPPPKLLHLSPSQISVARNDAPSTPRWSLIPDARNCDVSYGQRR